MKVEILLKRISNVTDVVNNSKRMLPHQSCSPLTYMAKGKQARREAAARARLFRHNLSEPDIITQVPRDAESSPGAASIETIMSNDDAVESVPEAQPVESEQAKNLDEAEIVCTWDGSVNHDPPELNDEEAWEMEEEDWGQFQELTGQESNDAVEAELVERVRVLHAVKAYDMLARTISRKEWVKAEQKRGGYTGNSKRTERRKKLIMKEKQIQHKKLRNT
ncbi:hypothetical protein F5880DRAFT_1588744 [Lentinula raphanica]|nr:hypothetical protein F5880DRAFT_1588744 [Lentinula raphanica]